MPEAFIVFKHAYEWVWMMQGPLSDAFEDW